MTGRQNYSRAGTQHQVLVHNANASALIAEALLAAGLLRERDWCGSFEKSINAGLKRWLNVQMDAQGWHFFKPLILLYTDSSERASEDMSFECWIDNFEAEENRPVGFFAFAWNQHEAQGINVSRQTLALEKAFPNVGFGLFRLLEAAFRLSVNGHTFGWGANMVSDWTDEYYDVELDEGSTLLNLKRFNERIPEGTHVVNYDHSLVQDALARARRSGWKRHLVPVLENIVRLFDLVDAAEQECFDPDHHHLFDSYEMDPCRHPSVYTYWNDNVEKTTGRLVKDTEDPMHRIIDEHYTQMMEGGYLTNMVWMHGFQLGFAGSSPGLSRSESQPSAMEDVRIADGSLPAAIHALHVCVEITGVVDKILQWLEADPHKPPNHKRSGSLQNVFHEYDDSRIKDERQQERRGATTATRAMITEL